MKLVIVETSAQAKVVSEQLGEGWRVEPCYGFVRDLPPNELGIDLKDSFRPTFNIVKGKGGIVVRLKQALREADATYAATPPGNEGEAMAWHVLGLEPSIAEKKQPVYRVTLDALTPDTIREAFASPLPLDIKRVEAALTVRIADRLAGYTVNTAASKALGTETRLTYAGMIALRYLANREAAASRSYWLSGVRLFVGDETFTAKILNAKGKPLALRSEQQVEQLRRMLLHVSTWVEKAGGTTKMHAAPDPLTMPSLIELAAQELGMPTRRTLSLVSTLYEAGRITHPDGIMLAASTGAAQAYVRQEFGDAYMSSTEPAVNGIAPVQVSRLPEEVQGDGAAIYGLIWRYFVAAHTAPAQERITAVCIRVGPARDKPYPVTLLAQASETAFDGSMRIFKNRQPDEVTGGLPMLKEGTAIGSTDAELVLEQRRMGEPFSELSLATTLMRSGFSATTAIEAANHLQNSGLITVDNGSFILTDDGLQTAAYLKEAFGKLTNPAYAAEFFVGVEAIATGEQSRADVLAEFWSRCNGDMAAWKEEIPSRKPVMLHALEQVSR